MMMTTSRFGARAAALKHLKETERSLDTAVKNKEYEEAAELNKVIKTIKSQNTESGLMNE